MDLNDKAQLRALLAQRTAEYESKEGKIDASPASAEQYAQALRQVQPSITLKQRQMLIGHALAPGQVLTMTELANLADGEGFHVANSQYGALGRKLAEALGIARPKWWVHTLASFDPTLDTNKRPAQMHAPLLEALAHLGWLPGTGDTPHSAGRATGVRALAVLSSEAVITGVIQAGFVRPGPPIQKLARFFHPTLRETLFVKLSDSENPQQRTPLVVHPRFEAQLGDWLQLTGVIGGNNRYYHNADMAGFPKRMHGGASAIQYGIDLGVRDAQALQALLSQLLRVAAQPVAADPVAPPAAPAVPAYSLDGIAHDETERDALIKARIGQGAYRDALLAYWQGCAVTGCSLAVMLRASHIKPWRSSTGQERLDPFNGLLLTPNLDLAFDQGLISFDDAGHVILSPQLYGTSAENLCLSPGMRLREVTSKHQVYLAWHREHVFRG